MTENTNQTVSRYRSMQEATDEVIRELNVRSRCFPRWIKDGRVSETDAIDRLDRLASALLIMEVVGSMQPTDSVADVLAAVEEKQRSSKAKS